MGGEDWMLFLKYIQMNGRERYRFKVEAMFQCLRFYCFDLLKIRLLLQY
jgi:hypothetical protein